MKKIITSLLIVAACSLQIEPGFSQDEIGIHFGPHGVDLYSKPFSDYYSVPPDRLSWLNSQRIPYSDWPLLFELARESNRPIEDIVVLRQHRRSWYDIVSQLGVQPSFLYLDVPQERYGPPYGRAYGYYREHPTESVRWSDAELARLGAVKFLVARTHRPPAEVIRYYEKTPVMRMRWEGKEKEGHSDKEKHEKHGDNGNNGHGNNGHGKNGHGNNGHGHGNS